MTAEGLPAWAWLVTGCCLIAGVLFLIAISLRGAWWDYQAFREGEIQFGFSTPATEEEDRPLEAPIELPLPKEPAHR